ncbi:MAG TPA: hypothetical protein VFW47_05635 [Phenylobacterium sp.]|nr:hypothetical protein [Phenylobacterium sp.]
MQADVSHFTMVGFAFDATDQQTALRRLVVQAQKACHLVELDAEHADCVVTDPSGAELYVALRRKSGGAAEFVTLNPGFSGEGRTTIEVQGDNTDPEWAPFEISVAGRFAGQETPLIVDLADPTQAARFKPGSRLTIDIAAFSYAPNVYADEAAYYAAQKAPGQKVRMAADFFVPSGMLFEKMGGALADSDKRPTAYADFAGKVLKTAIRTNGVGGESFRWALVETYDHATIDVVIDPKSIPQEPKVGSIISGRFWLSARIAP